MDKTVFRIDKMDCSAEEQVVRMRLEGMEPVKRLEFDLSERTVAVYHDGAGGVIGSSLESLGLGAREIEHQGAVALSDEEPPPTTERRPLLIALMINATFFVAEFVAGLIAGSMGLIADSLDNFADAARAAWL